MASPPTAHFISDAHPSNEGRDDMDTVVLVGEHTAERRLEATILRRYGFAVRSAWPPDAALSACASETPDLVLAPAALKDGNGTPFTAALRRLQASCDPAVLCLAATLEEFDEEMERGGADTVLLRPVRARRLVEELTMLSERRPPRPDRPVGGRTPAHRRLHPHR